jgi:hypothetical protein
MNLRASVLCLACCALPLASPAQRVEYEEEPHNYFSSPLHDPCTKLDDDFRAGRISIDPSDSKAMMRQILAALGVPEASQVLVFSKTSLQKDLISPSTPRAMFFSDDCYVGWVPGGMAEVSGIDPHLGPIFYFLNPDRPDRATPRLDRPENCMNCHGGSMTNNVPGVMIRSVFTDHDGGLLLQAGTSLIDHTSPLESRWGGWYVTGKHGDSRHMGNATANVHGSSVDLNREKGANLTDLSGHFNTSRYLRPDSDIVALMTLEHQVAMHSRLTEAAYDLRSAITRQKALRRELNEPETDEFVGSTKTVAESHAQKVLQCLLFCGEAEMPDGGIDGSRDFKDAFRANRRTSPEGKSLKDFQLLTRLFKYRCSYLIYSAQWDALPERFRLLLYDRLLAILTATSPVRGFEHLGPGERTDILQILRTTKQDLPDAWKQS